MKIRMRATLTLVVAMIVGVTPAAVGSDGLLHPEVAEMAEGTSSGYKLGEPGSSPSETMAAQAEDYYNCVLHPSVVHKRKSGNYNTVGAKPYTACTEGTPSRISHESTLYKGSWFGLRWEAMDTKSNSNTNERSLVLRTVSWRCVNSNESDFIQRTSGQSVQAGKTFYSNVSTAEARLTCGN